MVVETRAFKFIVVLNRVRCHAGDRTSRSHADRQEDAPQENSRGSGAVKRFSTKGETKFLSHLRKTRLFTTLRLHQYLIDHICHPKRVIPDLQDMEARSGHLDDVREERVSKRQKKQPKTCLEDISNDALGEILKFLGGWDLVACRQVNHRLCDMVDARFLKQAIALRSGKTPSEMLEATQKFPKIEEVNTLGKLDSSILQQCPANVTSMGVMYFEDSPTDCCWPQHLTNLWIDLYHKDTLQNIHASHFSNLKKLQLHDPYLDHKAEEPWVDLSLTKNLTDFDCTGLDLSTLPHPENILKLSVCFKLVPNIERFVNVRELTIIGQWTCNTPLVHLTSLDLSVQNPPPEVSSIIYGPSLTSLRLNGPARFLKIMMNQIPTSVKQLSLTSLNSDPLDLPPIHTAIERLVLWYVSPEPFTQNPHIREFEFGGNFFDALPFTPVACKRLKLYGNLQGFDGATIPQQVQVLRICCGLTPSQLHTFRPGLRLEYPSRLWPEDLDPKTFNITFWNTVSSTIGAFSTDDHAIPT